MFSIPLELYQIYAISTELNSEKRAILCSKMWHLSKSPTVWTLLGALTFASY